MVRIDLNSRDTTENLEHVKKKNLSQKTLKSQFTFMNLGKGKKKKKKSLWWRVQYSKQVILTPKQGTAKAEMYGNVFPNSLRPMLINV